MHYQLRKISISYRIIETNSMGHGCLENIYIRLCFSLKRLGVRKIEEQNIRHAYGYKQLEQERFTYY